MSQNFHKFSERTYETLKKLNKSKEKSITDKNLVELLQCRTNGEIENILRNNFNVKSIMRDKIWLYCIDKMEWNTKDNYKSTMFNQWQMAFMKLLINNGITSKNEVGKILSESQIFNNINELEEMDFIVRIESKKTFNRKVFYIIHPEILQKYKNA